MAQEDDDPRILRKEYEASLARIGVLEKENEELRQEVIRLKAQIGSLKAHDSERKAILWKKIQSPIDSCHADASQQKQSEFVKASEQNLDAENCQPRPNVQELDAGKDRSTEVTKPPAKPTPVILPSGNENKAKVPSLLRASPAPPPPIFTTKLVAGSKRVRRVPEVVELYRSLTRKDADMENRTNSTATKAVGFTKDMIGEIENRSNYVLAIKSDVNKRKELINFLINELEAASFAEISEVETFLKWLDGELSCLADERAVLKHFPQWPDRKADALREAACNYRDLKNLESEVSSFEDNQKEPLAQATRRMQALQDRLEHGVSSTEKMRESTSKKYKAYQIPCDWMMDSGLVGQMKLSSLKLGREYMRRIAKELLQSNESSREDNLLLQGARFANRVHQFVGGFDAETIQAFEEMKKIGLSSHK